MKQKSRLLLIQYIQVTPLMISVSTGCETEVSAVVNSIYSSDTVDDSSAGAKQETEKKQIAAVTGKTKTFLFISNPGSDRA